MKLEFYGGGASSLELAGYSSGNEQRTDLDRLEELVRNNEARDFRGYFQRNGLPDELSGYQSNADQAQGCFLRDQREFAIVSQQRNANPESTAVYDSYVEQSREYIQSTAYWIEQGTRFHSRVSAVLDQRDEYLRGIIAQESPHPEALQWATTERRAQQRTAQRLAPPADNREIASAVHRSSAHMGAYAARMARLVQESANQSQQQGGPYVPSQNGPTRRRPRSGG